MALGSRGHLNSYYVSRETERSPPRVGPKSKKKNAVNHALRPNGRIPMLVSYTRGCSNEKSGGDGVLAKSAAISVHRNFHRDWLDKKLRIMATRSLAAP